MGLLANTADYRPTVLEGGRRYKPRRRPGRFGQPLQSTLLNFDMMVDCAGRWQARRTWPRRLGLQPPIPEAGPLYMTTGSHWAKCVLRPCEVFHDPSAEDLWGCRYRLWGGQQHVGQTRPPWRMSLVGGGVMSGIEHGPTSVGLLIDVVQQFRPTESVDLIVTTPLRRLTAFGRRDLGPVGDVAQACQLSNVIFAGSFNRFAV